jgi:hypothetical protein
LVGDVDPAIEVLREAAAIYLALSIISGIGQAYLERRANQGYA